MHSGPNQSFWGLLGVWKHDWTFRNLGQWLWMWVPNIPMLLSPTYEIYLKCKYQLKQKTIAREKMLELIKSTFSEVPKP